jgi:hypothetical protein
MLNRWRCGASGKEDCGVTDRKREFERSNAFVDNELERDARDEVLAAAARDPSLARELSVLNRLKSTAEDSVAVPEIDIPAPPVWRGLGRRAASAVAACVALLILVGVGWTFLSQRGPDQGLSVAWAIEAHGSWKTGTAESGITTMLHPARARLNAYVPDLSSAGLRLAYIGEGRVPEGKPALIAGYRGTRGCRVTLLVDRSPGGLLEKAIYFEVDRLIAMVWGAGGLRHAIIAEGMANDRFRLIAETVHRASLERLPIEEASRMALAYSRASSPPCAA